MMRMRSVAARFAWSLVRTLVPAIVLLDASVAAGAIPPANRVGWNLPAIPLRGPYWAGDTLELHLKLEGFGADARSSDRVLRVECIINGTANPARKGAAGEYVARITAPRDQPRLVAAWRLVTSGGPNDGPQASAQLTPHVKLPRQVSVTWEGDIPGGCAVDHACKPISALRRSAVPPRAFVSVRRPGRIGNPYGEIVIRQGAKVPVYVPWQGPPTIVPYGRDIAICIVPPRCNESSVTDWTEDIEVDIVTATLAARSVSIGPMRVGLAARYVPGSWIECHAIWFASLASAAFAVFLWLGFSTPKSFSRAVQIKFASSEKHLGRSSYRVVRTLAGGRSGFYRSAAVGISEAGFPVHGRGWVLQLNPSPSGGVQVSMRSTVEMKGKGRWTPIKSGEILLEGTTYRCGRIYFRLG